MRAGDAAAPVTAGTAEMPEPSRFVVKDPPPGSARPRGDWEPGDRAVFGVELDGRIRQWSPAAARLFGRTAGCAIGRDLAGLLVRPDDRSRVADALSGVADGIRRRGVLAVMSGGGPGEPAPPVWDVEFCWDPVEDAAGGVQAVVTAWPAGEIGRRRGGHPEDGLTADQARLALLNEAGARIGRTLDLGRTAAELMDVVVPRLADAAGVLVHEQVVVTHEFPEDDGSAVVRRLAVAVADGNVEEWRQAFPIDEVTVYSPWSPYARCMETARPILLPRVGTELAEGIGRRMWRREEVFQVLRETSFLVVPLKARGRVLGFAVLTRRRDREAFGEQDVALAEELAARTAVCIDNARLYHRERRTALALQSSLLPAELPSPPGLEIAHRYLPASDLEGVGGDWYDVIPLPGRRVALVVGDVMGHGTEAAATMGQLRTSVRTLAALDLPPADVLLRLDQMTQDLSAIQIATCVYSTYDPVEGIWTLARAGHVPPIALHPGGAIELVDLPPALPLGIGGEPFEARELRLAPDSTLVLCTDGLVESRSRDIEAGLAELCKTLDGARHGGLEDMCDTAIEVLRPNHDRDDIALLAARVRPLNAGEFAAAVLEAEPAAVRDARELVRERLAAWRLDHLADVAELLVSELATNSVRHGAGPMEVRLLRDDIALLCEVADASPAPPLLRPADLLAESGRGMQLVKTLAQRWGCRPGRAGKVVWFELPARPPEL